MDKFRYQKANILSQPNQVKPFYRKNGRRIFTSPRSAMVGQCADTCTDYISGREPNRPRHSNRGYASYNVSLVAIFLPMSCTPDETGPYLVNPDPVRYCVLIRRSIYLHVLLHYLFLAIHSKDLAQCLYFFFLMHMRSSSRRREAILFSAFKKKMA